MFYIAVGAVLFTVGAGSRPYLDRGRDEVGLWWRGRRYRAGTVYKCAKCEWWWEYRGGGEWLGPYWVEKGRTSGQCPEPGEGRRRTWPEMEFSYTDCVPHLRPAVDQALIRVAMGS